MARDQITQNLSSQLHEVLKEQRDRLHHRTLTHTTSQTDTRSSRAADVTDSTGGKVNVRGKVVRSGSLCPAEYLLVRVVGGLDLEFVCQALIDLPEVLHRGLKVHTQITAAGRHRQPRVVWDSWRMEGGATFMAIVEEHTAQDKVLTRHHR